MTRRKLIAALTGIALLVPAFAFAAEEAAEGGGSWLMLMFFAINFSLFVVILVRFAVPMARTYFSDRAKGIRSDLDRLGAAFKEAQDYANRAAARMAKLEDEARQLAAEMGAETVFQIKRVREGAKADAERIRADSQLTASAIAQAGQRRVRERLAATAANLARDLIARAFEPSDQGRLIDGFMEKLHQEAPR